MLFPSACKIEAVASRDENRYALCEPYLDLSRANEPRLVATDGHCLVALPVFADDVDVSGPIPVAALRLARRLKQNVEEEDFSGVVCLADRCIVFERQKKTVRGKVRTSFVEHEFPRRTNVHFVEWRQVVPRGLKDKSQTTQPVTFHPRLLWAVAQGLGVSEIGQEGIYLVYADPLSPIKVANPRGADACIMPMRT